MVELMVNFKMAMILWPQSGVGWKPWLGRSTAVLLLES
jgi:hypothetical protein